VTAGLVALKKCGGEKERGVGVGRELCMGVYCIFEWRELVVVKS
jgi:hypothetical protein